MNAAAYRRGVAEKARHSWRIELSLSTNEAVTAAVKTRSVVMAFCSPARRAYALRLIFFCAHRCVPRAAASCRWRRAAQNGLKHSPLACMPRMAAKTSRRIASSRPGGIRAAQRRRRRRNQMVATESGRKAVEAKTAHRHRRITSACAAAAKNAAKNRIYARCIANIYISAVTASNQ